MSSTAIAGKLMADRLELESEHGRRVMGVLLFQDLAVVPLLVLIPALGSSPEALLRELAIASLKAVVLLTLLLVGGQRVMRWWLTIVVPAGRARNSSSSTCCSSRSASPG